jgi:hypothetical protein
VIRILEQRPILTIISVVGVLLLPYLGVLEVTIMEARNFISAREMITDNQWILTTMNGEPRYQKPPLPTWLTAMSGMLFGFKSIWGLRMPAVGMVMLLGSIMYTLSRKLNLNKSHSLINGLVLVTSVYVLLIIFEAPWDIFAHAFMLTGIYFIVQLLRADLFSWIVALGAIFFIGCSILSKGPVSFYVLLLSFFIAYGFAFKGGVFRRKWQLLLLVLCLALVLGFSWYAYARFADPETFNAITAKETGNWTSYNVRPFYYYWSFFVQSGLWTIPAFISLLYPYLKSRVSNLKVYRFTILWTLVAVVLLSVIPEKKSRYLMPVLIPLAMNIGFYLEYLVRRFKELKDPRETIPVYVQFSLVGLILSALPMVAIYVVVFELSVLYMDAILVILLSCICGLAILYHLFKKRMHQVFMYSIVGIVFGGLSLFAVKKSMPMANEQYQDFFAFSYLESYPVYAYEFTSPELVWASGQKLPRLNAEDPLPLENVYYLLLDIRSENELKEHFSRYAAVKVYDININQSALGTREYKKRKMATVFKMTLKPQ